MEYKILIVDDSEIIRMVLSRIIGMINLPVKSIRLAGHGKEALQLINEETPDIIFTDLNMPEMSGIELIEELSKAEKLKGISTLVISTEGNEERIEYLKSLGVNRYMRKPFTPQSVKAELENLIGEWS